VRRAPRSIAWAAALALCVTSCTSWSWPPPPDKGSAPKLKPKAARPSPAKPAPAKPAAAKAAPAKPVALPDGLFLFSPQQRTSYVAGETAEITLVICSSVTIADATVALSLDDGMGRKWTAADPLGPVAPGRHSLSYGIEVGLFPPGSYTFAAELAGKSFGTRRLTFAPSVPATHFRIAGWVEKPPRGPMDAARWSRALGLNTVLVQARSPWLAKHTLDAGYAAACQKLRAAKVAKPLELTWPVPPFVATGDRLTGAGLRWVNACAVSGGGQPHLRPERSFADPAVVRGARQRIHHRVLAERQFRNCLGIHFSNETTLSWARRATYEGPFGVPAQLAAFKQRTGLKDVAWQAGAKQWELWHKFMTYRAGILGSCLSDWAGAVGVVEPGYVATSQVYSPTRLGEGAYPPLQGAGLPVISTQASLDGPAGMMMAAMVADLERAGNWGKRLWFMPELADDAELDEARAAISLALARKIEGVVYPPTLDYHLDRPAAGQFPSQLFEGASGVSAQLTRFGDFLLALRKPRADVAILYSVTEHIARIGENPAKDPHGARYPWSVLAAYEACMFAHFAPTLLTEGELLAGQGAPSKVVLVVGLTRMRPEVKAALEAHVAAGGVVLTDLATTAHIEGAKELAIRFPDLHAYHEELWRKGEQEKVDTTLERRDEVVQAKLVYPDLVRLRRRLKEFIDRDFTVSDKTVIVCDQRCGAGRYLFVVNNEHRTDIFRGLKWELRAARTRVTLREGDFKAYDVFGGVPLSLPYVKGHPVVDLVLPAGGVDCIALLPEPVRGVMIDSVRPRAGELSVEAYVHGEDDGEPLNAAVPLEVTVVAPSGKPYLRLFRAHTPEGYEETLALPTLAAPGQWTVVVRELLSGEQAKAPFALEPAAATSWVSRRGGVAAFDGDRIAALLASPKPLWIVAGTPEEAKKAEPLAAALRRENRAVEIKLAAQVAKPRYLDATAAATYVSAAPAGRTMPDVRQPAILLGDITTHPLLQAVHNYGLLPRAVTPDFPGQGRALLCWLLSTFEPDVPTVVAAAADGPGVDRAIQLLLAAARGKAPRTAWRPLPGAETAAEPADKRKILRLASRWSQRTLDNPVAIAAPPGSPTAVVGFYHGAVTSYDIIGKPQWTHFCSSRSRTVASSLDGSWTLAASFPEVAMLSARGRVAWAVPIEETSLRADFTAAAVSPQGELNVAGTRQGRVFGLDFDGRQVFTAGAEDADEKTEGWQSRFGAINALAVTPKVDAVVVAGELELAAFDRTGQELWTTKQLRRVTTMAVGLDEAQQIAVGSRDGFVACLEKQGTVLWRSPTKGYVASVCFLGTSHHVLAACLDGTLTCFDDKGKMLWRRQSPVGFRHVASSLKGDVVAAAELAGRVLLLDGAGDVFADTPPLDGVIRVLALSFDGGRLFVGTSANRLLLFRYTPPRADEDEL